MRYLHKWHSEREDPDDPGTQEPGGEWTPGEPLVVYDGPADAQDKGEIVKRDEEGRAIVVSDAVLYLPRTFSVASQKIGDIGTITWEDGTTDDARVIGIVRLDNHLQLGWV